MILTFAAIALTIYGLLGGNWNDFIEQWQTSRFIHVMSLDFCLLSLLFPTLLGDDMARRKMKGSLLFGGVTLVPLFGALFYLCVCSPLSQAIPSSSLTEPPSVVVKN